jgi:hypothetical protein
LGHHHRPNVSPPADVTSTLTFDEAADQQHPLFASPRNDANLMAGLHAGDRVDTKPTEQGGGVESL